MSQLQAKDLDDYASTASAIEAAVSTRIAGQADLIRQIMVCLLAEGHVLLEGVPGLGKTELVKSFSTAISVDFARVQFTPDLMPADIVGTQVLEEDDQGHRRFQYRPGPVFTNFLLADEINRATPKTQAALLEAMQERQVTVGGVTRPLPRPFLVLATQNPIELEGTYPLPEAQLDRFLFKVNVNPPTAVVLEEILRRTTTGSTPEIPIVADVGQISTMIATTPKLPIASHLLKYVSQLIAATHPQGDAASPSVSKYVRWGSSPRGGQAIVLASKAAAMIDGRPHVSADDIRWAAAAALRHRLVLGFEAITEGVRADDIIEEVLESTPEPKAEIRGTP